MRSWLYRGTEYAIAAAVVAVLWAGPRVVDHVLGWPPADERLIQAVSAKDPADFERAIADSGSVRGRDARGTTALMMAAAAGNVVRMQRLIDLGAEVDAADYWGKTPLMFAATCDHPDAVRLLLRHGADPDRRDRFGQTAADLAKIRAADCVEAVLANAARVGPKG